ncbi:MAG: hypothetical protein M3371_06670 [Acidobacteriota bacterium]|nr:hypothetical protein [Acidobacteriota bacterium]
MKEFSISEQARKALSSSPVEDLGCVFNISRRFYEEHDTFVFYAQPPCLEYLSLLIENALLLRTQRAGRVYAGFEKLSRMEAVVDRYLRIADLSERVYVIGEADWSPPRHPNLRVLPVAPGAKLTRENFIIADSPYLQVALVAAQTHDEFAAPPEARAFHATKSSAPAVVRQLAAAMEKLIDRSITAHG